VLPPAIQDRHFIAQERWTKRQTIKRKEKEFLALLKSGKSVEDVIQFYEGK
jgi:hypothetical protein